MTKEAFTVQEIHPKIQLAHPRFVLDLKDLTIDNLSGATSKILKLEADVFSVFVAQTGRILMEDDFQHVIDGWNNLEPRVINNRLRTHISRIRTHLDSLGLSSQIFPHGYLLTVPGRGNVLVNPDKPDHIADFKQYAAKLPSTRKR